MFYKQITERSIGIFSGHLDKLITTIQVDDNSLSNKEVMILFLKYQYKESYSEKVVKITDKYYSIKEPYGNEHVYYKVKNAKIIKLYSKEK